MKKRILLTLLALALIVSAVAVTAFAATIRPDTDPLVVEYETGTTPTSPYLSEVTGTTMTISGIADLTNIQYKLGESGDVKTINLTSTHQSSGSYTITGLVEGETYFVALKHKTVTASQSGDGNSYIYNYSAFVQVDLVSLIDNGNKWDAPLGLSIAKNKLAGYTAGVSYEFVKVNTLADVLVDETAFASLDVLNTNLTAGLWAVRRAEGDDGSEKFGASEPVILYSRGADAGTFALTGSTEITQGKWTRLGETALKSAGASTQYPHALVMHIDMADKAGFIDGSIYYPMADSEIIPAEDFFSFTFNVSQAVAGLIDNFSDENFYVPGQVIFHTIGGSEDSYSIDFSWRYNTTNKIDLTTIADRDGYIYAIEIDLFADSSENYTINASGYTYQLINFSGGLSDPEGNKLNIVGYTSRGVHATPKLDTEGSTVIGSYVIKGFDPALDYMMSTDNINFTPVQDGAASITVSATGRYYFYVVADAQNAQSDTMSVYIQGAMPVMTGLVLDKATNTVSGFDSSKGFIEWAQVTLGEYDWTVKTNDADVTLPGNGLYVFRYQKDPTQNRVSGAPYYIYIRGTDVGTIKYRVTSGTDYHSTHTGGFLPGFWTTYKGGTYIDSNKITAGFNFSLENATKMGFMYQLTNEEVLPVAELADFSLSFSISVKTYDYYEAPFNAVLRIYVAGADVEYYDINISIPENKVTTFSVADLWKDDVARDPNFTPAGYVVGLQTFLFNPMADNDISFVSGSTASNYLQMAVAGVSGSVINLGVKEHVDVDAIRTVRAVIGYNSGDNQDCGEIIGLNPYATYQIAQANRIDDNNFEITGEWSNDFTGISAIAVPAGDWAVRAYFTADNPDFISSEPVCVTVLPADPEETRDSAKVPKVLLPEDVAYADVDYVFDIDQTRWINRLTIENILTSSPNATIVFEADNYRFTVKASDIDLSLSSAHYFDMMVSFDGESEYDRMYKKMAALADEDEMVCGIHFESTTGYFFETAVFEVNLGAELDGMEVDLRSFNERVNRLRSEETTIVEGGWATFSVFGADYVILSPEFAEANAE